MTMSQATAEASRCLLCHDPPCSRECPSNTDPGKFIRQLRLLNFKGAAATVKRNNVFGGVCGLLCPTCTLCQEGCSAAGLGEPIDIGALQYFAVEQAWRMGFSALQAGEPNGKRIAVVGAGPSGLCCAAELAQEGFEVVVFERLDAPGGVLRYVLPEHRLNPEILLREIEDVTALGVEIRYGQSFESEEELERLLNEEGFAAVYVATGAWTSITLDIPGRNLDNIFDGMSFLRQVREQRAETEALLEGRSVAVIGGGDTAMDAAVSAKRCGAKDVYLLYRRSFAQMPGDDKEKHDALSEGVHFVILTQPVGYEAADGKLAGVRVVRNTLGEPDPSGRRRPVAVADSEYLFEADIVIEAIGQKPNPKTQKLGAPQRASAGLMKLGASRGPKKPRRIFAGGDAVRGPSLITHAVGDGKRAAAAIKAQLLGEK